jgi:hypothetical protein
MPGQSSRSHLPSDTFASSMGANSCRKSHSASRREGPSHFPLASAHRTLLLPCYLPGDTCVSPNGAITCRNSPLGSRTEGVTHSTFPSAHCTWVPPYTHRSPSVVPLIIYQWYYGGTTVRLRCGAGPARRKRRLEGGACYRGLRLRGIFSPLIGSSRRLPPTRRCQP